MIHRLGPLGKVIFALLSALILGWVTASWFSSLEETATAAISMLGFQFLAGMIVGALTRGKQAGLSVVIFSVSFLWWPAWNGLLRQVEGLELYMMLEVMPTMIGGFLALAIHSCAKRILEAGSRLERQGSRTTPSENTRTLR